MSRDVLFPLVAGFVGLILAVGGYLTMYRRYTGLIAGFDASRVTDVSGLTRWVGGTGILLGAAFVVAAVTYSAAPHSHRLVAAGLAVAILVGVIVSVGGCSRYVRR